MIDFLSRVVVRQLCTMATVIKDAFLAVGRAIKQPVDPLANRRSGGALVEHDSDIFSVKPDFLQNTAHEKDVVHTAFQPRRGIGIIVNADEQCAPPALLHRALELRASAGKARTPGRCASTR